jgi:ferredoxin
MAEYSIEVDQQICLGSGLCTTYAPNTFDQDEDTAKVFVKAVGEDSLEDVQAAAESCPMAAIKVTVN